MRLVTASARLPHIGVTETGFRLALLTVATIATSLYAWHFIHFATRGEAWIAAAAACGDLPNFGTVDGFRSPLARCWAAVNRPVAHTMTTGLAITLIATVVVLGILPLVLHRRRKLIPLDPTTHPAVARVEKLAGPLGLVSPPLLGDPRPHAAGRTIGGWDAPRLVLTFGLLPLATSRQQDFDAVVAHELSHLRNRDVHKTEFAVAAWWALVLAVVTPYLVAAATAPLEFVRLDVVIRFAVVTAGTLLLRNAVLRVREHEADVRASTLPAVAPVLIGLLDSDERREDGLWRGWWARHPSSAARVAVLERPDLLLRAVPADAFALGFVSYLPLEALGLWWSNYTYGRPAMAHGPILSALLLGAILGGGLWAMGWRQASREQVAADAPRRTLACGLALGIGVVTASLLIPMPTEGSRVVHFLTSHVQLLAGSLTMLGAVAAVAIIFLWARRWVSRGRGDFAGRLYLTGALMAAGVVGILYTAFTSVPDTIRDFEEEPLGALIVSLNNTATSPLIWVTAAAVLAGRLTLGRIGPRVHEATAVNHD